MKNHKKPNNNSKSTIQPDVDAAEVARYIRDMAIELHSLAGQANLPFLAELIHLVAFQANKELTDLNQQAKAYLDKSS